MNRGKPMTVWRVHAFRYDRPRVERFSHLRRTKAAALAEAARLEAGGYGPVQIEVGTVDRWAEVPW